ncbi:MAG TPA: neutral zinc metallopeptidase [Phototrophicaceae bacterium]|jgi:hypothetical protein|nr:neutral zinc metallopeptidase [Phototrophicaceae bacterium]
MSRQKTPVFLFILLLVFSFAVFIPAASAQEEDEPSACVYFTPDGGESSLDDLPFMDCAAALYNQMVTDGEVEAYGYWGESLISVTEAGEVYYAEDAPEPDWIYWDTLDLEGSGDSTDEPSTDEPSTDDPSLDDQSPDDPANTLPFDELMDLAATDIDTFWQQVFTDQEIEYVRPDILFFEEDSVESACGDMLASSGPFYCGGDNIMYYPVAFMTDQYSRIGDFAAVLVMAHEWGHSAQMQMGLMDTQMMSIDMELQADCLAGAYGGYVATQSELAQLDANDINEGMQSLFEVGDSEDTPWFAPDAHGTSEERQQSFMSGFDNGIELCLTPATSDNSE